MLRLLIMNDGMKNAQETESVLVFFAKAASEESGFSIGHHLKLRENVWQLQRRCGHLPPWRNYLWKIEIISLMETKAHNILKAKFEWVIH